MTAPDCTIDFERAFSLPFGVPPALPTAQLAMYLGDLGLSADFLVYDRNDALPIDVDANPVRASALRAQALPMATGNAQLLLPTATELPPPLVLETSFQTIASASLDAVGPTRWRPAEAQNSRTLPEVAASTFLWDDDSRKAAALPMPMLTDESLVLRWTAAAPAGGLLPAPLEGVLDTDAATHLLATSGTARDGELDRLLLRSPVLGLIRFQRYRHLLRNPDGSLQVRAPSAAGTVLIKLLPTALTPPDTPSPLFAERTLVFEDVAASDAAECFTSLVYLQLAKFEELVGQKKFNNPLRGQCTWLFRSWLAFLQLNASFGNPLSGVDAALVAPFKEGAAPKPQTKEIQDFATAVRGDAAARQGLIEFVRGYYAPVLCGRSWKELGIDVPVDPSSRGSDARAHATLEHLMKAGDTWLVGYAGCPVGKPALQYSAADSLSTFELEALVLAGKTDATFPGIPAPSPPPDNLTPIDLSAFASGSAGYRLALRAVDTSPPKQEFTTVDWLAETVKGANRLAASEPEIDFEGFAIHGHPLSTPVYWSSYEEARQLRASLDDLGDATVGAQRLNRAILQWWIDRSGLGPDWPTQIAAGRVEDRTASPQSPYLAGRTRPGISGFDEFDLEAVLEARRVVWDGRALVGQVEPALFLALMEREGYRAFARNDRIGGLRGRGFIPMLRPDGTIETRAAAGAVANRRGFLDGLALRGWVLFPYGLDVFNRLVTDTSADILANARSSFLTHFEELDDADAVGPELHAGKAFGFAINRLDGAFRGADAEVNTRRRSRRLQWLGVICQQGEFQRRHNILANARTAVKLNKWWLPDPNGVKPEVVEEFTDLPVPAPGNDANSDERKRYIAYYALLYLAFNGSPQVFNDWVQEAKAAMGAGDKVSTFLTYLTNSAPRELEPDPAAPGARKLWHRGNMLRFAVALDAYLRLSPGGAADTSDPSSRAW